ncbi:MAG: hypothetical protein NT069_27570 [Planctomycetota bacterium]|nr:hypothetical protein [Planctomycetota bacterium]
MLERFVDMHVQVARFGCALPVLCQAFDHDFTVANYCIQAAECRDECGLGPVTE